MSVENPWVSEVVTLTVLGVLPSVVAPSAVLTGKVEPSKNLPGIIVV